MTRPRSSTKLAATLVATAVVVTGCFGGEGSKNSDGDAGTLVTDDGPPQSGGTFHIAGTADATSLELQK